MATAIKGGRILENDGILEGRCRGVRSKLQRAGSASQEISTLRRRLQLGTDFDNFVAEDFKSPLFTMWAKATCLLGLIILVGGPIHVQPYT